ncbi:MAG TPA: ABC transporter ATP-binding protein [Pseudothermotoga sp.]|nr:ABC transporter ATP-binding protein [Pseudothermotoga sp.]HOK82874.1 ABC transporter ATP-binding protein [Pseudothermotoga sp.]HPP69953.1 ABC transporter ATP-binding protein [Pseudothermotoga sp.]
MLEIKNLSIAYGKVQVIWDLSITVGSEAVGLFGPNGAGKTTLINCILGMIRPISGNIYFDGRDITGLETYQVVRLGIALVPQERELFPLMTVEENLKSGAAYIPHARNQLVDRMNFVFTIFPVLKERLSQKAGTMSGGEQRMLAVGRALMACPKLLILDEPSVGLQPSIVTEMFAKLKQIRMEGVSILLTEQNVKQGLKVIDRGYVIENGRIVIEDKSEKLAQEEHIKRAYLGV